MDRSKLFERYQETVFAAGNSFSEEEYRFNAEFYAQNYSGRLPARKDAPILDIGCGAGHFLYFLKNQGYSAMMGIDLSPELVERCRSGVWPKVERAEAVEFLTRNPGRFDLICANDVVEHIPKSDVLSLLSACRSSLSPGGLLVVKVPNMSNPFAGDLRYRDFTHEAGYTESSLFQVLSMAGFKQIQVSGSSHRSQGVKGCLHHLIEKLLQALVRRAMMEMNYSVPSTLNKCLIASAR